MKVIFRINTDNFRDYLERATRLKSAWEDSQDLECIIVSKDIDVFVVESDSEIEIMPPLPDYISEEERIKDNIPIEYCFGWKDCLDTIRGNKDESSKCR